MKPIRTQSYLISRTLLLLVIPAMAIATLKIILQPQRQIESSSPVAIPREEGQSTLQGKGENVETLQPTLVDTRVGEGSVDARFELTQTPMPNANTIVQRPEKVLPEAKVGNTAIASLVDKPSAISSQPARRTFVRVANIAPKNTVSIKPQPTANAISHAAPGVFDTEKAPVEEAAPEKLVVAQEPTPVETPQSFSSQETTAVVLGNSTLSEATTDISAQNLQAPQPESGGAATLAGVEAGAGEPLAAPVVAATTNNPSISEDASSEDLGQVTSVSQLSDVQPNDWAFEALKSLIERYGAIAGYPDGTFRGNQTMTRYEFAAALNAILKRLNATGAVKTEDLATLQKLQEQFAPELASLRDRVDTLEARTTNTEAHQFSTTTKLKGEVIFAATDTDKGEMTLSDRVRLNLSTSFGENSCKIRLQASNVPNLSPVTGSDMARLSFDAGNNNEVGLNELYCSLSFGEKIEKERRGRVWIGTTGLDIDDIFDVGNPKLSSSGTGSLSRSNRYSPLVHRGPEGAGMGIKYKLSPNVSVTALYLTDPKQASDPNKGLLDGDSSAGVQLDYKLNDGLRMGFTYLHTSFGKGSVNLANSTGSPITKDPFQGKVAATQDAFGLNADWQVSDKLLIGGWVGYADANAEGINSQAELWNWNAHLSLLDFGKKDAVLSLAGGQLPRAGYVSGFPSDNGTSYIVEAQYQYPIFQDKGSKIVLTPGFYVVLNPNHNNNNDPIWVGVVRTTFNF